MPAVTIWALLLGSLAALLTLSLLLPVPRRVWAFHLYAGKYLLLGLAELARLRKLAARLGGRRHQPLTRPRALRLFCEDMGPTFIKFGQIVASSAGMFPERYVEEFRKCLDEVRSFDFREVQRIVAEELGAEGKRQLSSIEPRPLASASIAQVHTAELADGTPVVIKVQRPGIAGRMAADMKIMRFAARVMRALSRDAEIANPVEVVDDFAATLREEIDFRQEASNLDRFNEIIRELGHADIRAPVPHWELTTRRVLVMERFVGIRVDDVEGLRARDADAEGLLVKGMRAWFQCVIFHGFFHGDVHAGNLMLLDDGDIGFLDFGIVGRFDALQRRQVTDYVVAFTTGDYGTLARTIAEMGGIGSDADLDAFAASLKKTYEPLRTMAFSAINYAEMAPKIHQVARDHGMTMPREFILITKQMLYFDRYAKLLAPELNVFTDPRLVMSLMMDIQKARAEG
jgi:predicted unusual protein kinase regulating ubiquinone biosynthesis (AarF/ABC1/UbiB family)